MLSDDFSLVNVGLPLIVQAVPEDRVYDLKWMPPAFADANAASMVSRLDNEVTRQANQKAIDLVHSVRPSLVRILPAREAIAELQSKTLLHSGPPIAVEKMCGPMIGGLVGAALFERWAKTPEQARELLNNGDINIMPCHEVGAVGPMAGIISPSMPVFEVTDGKRKAFSNLNEGLGKVLRFGAYDRSVIDRLVWMRDYLGPTLDAALQDHGPIDTTSLFVQALTMGDECHNRNIAATSLFTRRLAPSISKQKTAQEVLEFLANNDHFALNLSMAAAKLCLDAANGVADSTLVTAMARNGVEFGLRVAGAAEKWFTAPVEPADGLFFPGYSREDANPDLGDSAITESLGLGGFSMAASPAITQFIGGSPEDAQRITIEMTHITMSRHPVFQIPQLNFAGIPSGIDLIKVARSNVLPVINTGIAHKEAGVGQIGAGIVRAPRQVFLQAICYLAKKRGIA